MAIAVPGPSERIRVPCLTCKQKTWHEVSHDIPAGEHDPDSGWYTIVQHQIIKCCGCDNYSFRQTYEDAAWGPDEPPNETLWPPRSRKRQSLKNAHQLPRKVLQIYREANRALESDQPVLAAVGVRALVEAVCRQKRSVGRNLKLQIDHLVVRGLLTKAQATVPAQDAFPRKQGCT